MLIKEVRAKKISDSRGDPTIEVSVNGQSASAPAGKSVGKYETPSYYESLDWNIKFLNDANFYNMEINNFNDLASLESVIKSKGKFKDAKQFGANSLFAFEAAVLKACAVSQKKEVWQIINPKAKKLPIPLGNVVEGGLHAHNELAPDFQEFWIIPQEKSFSKNVTLMQEIYAELKKILKANIITDEGAWQVSMTNEEVLETLSKFNKVRIGIDVAASSFYKKENYIYKDKTLTPEFQMKYINYLIKKYNLFCIEDPLHEEDFIGFSKINRSKNIFILGDDLTATQILRLKKAVKYKSINAMIIKPNQNGSLIELNEIVKICKKNKIKKIFSHRSGETMETFLADLAFAFEADFFKAGVATKWREAKLNRIIEIENGKK